MKITLRKTEIDTLLNALSYAYNGDFAPSDKYNAAILRLIKKLEGAE